MTKDDELKSLLIRVGKAIVNKQWVKAITLSHKAISICPDSLDACLLMGIAYYRCGQYDGAYAAYKRALQIDSKNVVACKNLYYVCLKLEDYEIATVLLEQLIRLEPDDDGHRRHLKELYFRTGNTQKALDFVSEQGAEEKEKADQTESLNGYQERVFELIKGKKWDEAVKACKNAIKSRPNNIEGMVAFAYIEFQRGKFERVIEICRRILKKNANEIRAKQYTALAMLEMEQWEKAGKLFEELAGFDAQTLSGLRLGLKKEEVLANLALTYEKRKLMRTAKMTYEKLLEDEVELPELQERIENLEVPLAKVRRREPLIESASMSAIEASEKGEPTSPCPSCGQMVPNSADFCPFCGVVISEAKRCPKCNAALPDFAMFCGECGFDLRPGQHTCLHCFTSVANTEYYCPECGELILQACPGGDRITDYIAQIEGPLRQGNADEACDQFKKAVLQYPNLAVARLGLAMINEMLHHTDEAVSQYRKILDMAADPMIVAEACSRLGVLLAFAMRQPSQALKPLERGARLVPDDPSFSLIMGLAYFRMGERDKAMREFNRVLEFDPRNSVAFSCIGQLQAHNNRGEEAAQYYGRSVALLRMVRMRSQKRQ